MPLLLALALAAALHSSPLPNIGNNDGRPALPDTASFRAEWTAFGDLTPATRDAQAARAAKVLHDWVPDFRIADGAVKCDLQSALYRRIFRLIRSKREVLAVCEINLLSTTIRECQDGLAADPTNVPLHVLLGMIWAETGRPRDAVDELEKALLALEPVAPADDRTDPADTVAWAGYLRRTARIGLGYAYRDLGRLDRADRIADELLAENPTPRARVLKGLCLAGTGRTAEAISYAVRMEPIGFSRVNALSPGISPHPSAYANEWIKSQALLTDGNAQAAQAVLGEIDRRFLQGRMPLRDDYWQDAGLVAELLGDDDVGMYYGSGATGAFMRWVYPSEDSATNPLVLGFPARRAPCFITPDGGFKGGSPFGYLMEQMRIMADADNAHDVELARIRALDLCDGLLARRIRPDVVAAFRARIYLAAGQDEFAYPDLVYAHAAFASRGEVDPGTSILLGQQELIAGRNAESEELFREALAAVPDNALAWRELGVALARARQFALAREAMDRALALEPQSMEGWYNLGVLAYREGNHEQALTALETAWKIDPQDERIAQMLQTVATSRRLAGRQP